MSFKVLERYIVARTIGFARDCMQSTCGRDHTKCQRETLCACAEVSKPGGFSVGARLPLCQCPRISKRHNVPTIYLSF